MKLKEAIEKESHLRTCGVAQLLAKLPPADVADLIECLTNRQFTAPQIVRGLKMEGHVLSDNAIKRHRQEACNCAQ